MDNPSVPIPSISPRPAIQPEVFSPVEPSNRRWLLWLAGGLFMLIIGIAIGVFSAKFLNQSQGQPQLTSIPTPTQSPTLTPTPALTPDPTADWKTFNNKNYFYEIKYPQDWGTISSIQEGEKTEPIGLHGSELKGKIVDIHNNYPNNRVQPFLQIEVQAQTSFADFEARKPSWKGEQTTFMGKPAVKSIIQFNGEPSINLLPGTAYNLLVYSSENQMTYEIICNENRPANNGFCDQILSTFKFISPSG